MFKNCINYYRLNCGFVSLLSKSGKKPQFFHVFLPKTEKSTEFSGFIADFFKFFAPAACEKIFEKFSNIPFKRLTIY